MASGPAEGAYPVLNVADVITAAAQSTLGVLSLIVFGVGFIAFQFFGRSDDRVKLVVFVLIFAAAVGFGAAVLRETNKAKAADSQPTLDPTQSPASAADSTPAPAPTHTAASAADSQPAAALARTHSSTATSDEASTPNPVADESTKPDTRSEPRKADLEPAPQSSLLPHRDPKGDEGAPRGSVRGEYVTISSRAVKVILHNETNRVAIVKKVGVECPQGGSGKDEVSVISYLDVDSLPALIAGQTKLLTMPEVGGILPASGEHTNDECKVLMDVYVADVGLRNLSLPVLGSDLH